MQFGVTVPNYRHAEPRPIQQPHPPILIGGYGKRAIRRAVALGQGWLPDGMSLPDLAKAIGFMRETAASVGRDPASLSVALRTGLYLTSVGSKVPGKTAAPWEQSGQFAAEPERHPFRGSVEQVIVDIHEAERIGVVRGVLKVMDAAVESARAGRPVEIAQAVH